MIIKRILANWQITLILLIILGGVNKSLAQVNRHGVQLPKVMKYSKLNFGIGTTHYFGDISPESTLKALTTSIRWNINCSYVYTISPKVHFGIAASYIRLAGDDFYADNDFDFIRNLHFRNDLKQLSTFIEYHPLEYTTDFRKRLTLSPYLTAGIGYYFHNPQAKLPVKLGSQWVDLASAHTEGQGINPIYPAPYNLSGISIPLGLGLQYRYNKYFNFVFEVIHHSTFSDYLDDVSGIYPNNILFNDKIGAVLSNRSTEQIAANVGADRSERIINYLNAKGVSSPQPFEELGGFTGATGTDRGSKKGNDNFLVTTFKVQFLIPDLRIYCPKIN